MNGIDLSTASDIRLGGTTVSGVYLGSTLIWPTTHNYANDYFTIESLEDNNSIDFTGYITTLYYSLDNGSTWGTYNVQVSSPSAYITLNTGNTLLLKGQVNTIDYHITATKTFKVYGNLHSLLFSDSFASMNTLPSNFKNPKLFRSNDKLIDTTNLILPSINLSGRQQCYYEMFFNCTSLITAPELPATTLAYRCYAYMFSQCTALTTAPELPATTLEDSCYTHMFQYCTHLTNVPTRLPATTLANYCYHSMFNECRYLTIAPELPATILTEGCYYQMFSNCTRLNSITCLATDISAIDCTTGWVHGVASNGTFTKSADMTSWPTNDSGIPSSWTVQDA